MEFTEGEVVGKISEHKTEAEFAVTVNEEYGRDVDLESVKRIFVRWVARCPLWLDSDPKRGAYITCEKGRGAFKCFMIE